MKYLKCVKKFLSLLLILSLTSSVYVFAANNEGSAFITKDEFDRALTDFNARLRIFEAGVNSKIDSQVSTYLDRNGIWNEKIQEFDGSDMVALDASHAWKGWVLDVSSFAGEFLWDEDTSTSTAPGISHVNKNTKVLYETPAKIIINKFSKSGLCFLPINMHIGQSAEVAKQRFWDNDPTLVDNGSEYVRISHFDSSIVHNVTINTSNNSMIEWSMVLGLNDKQDKTFTKWSMEKVQYSGLIEMVDDINISSSQQISATTTHNDKAAVSLTLSFVDIVNDNNMFFVDKGDQLVMKFRVDFFPQSTYATEIVWGTASTKNYYNCTPYNTALGNLCYAFSDNIKVY